MERERERERDRDREIEIYRPRPAYFNQTDGHAGRQAGR